MQGRLQERSDVVAFLELPNGATPTYRRMKGFTGLSISKNPRTYARQYVDETQEQTDVVGYSSGISFGYDKYVGDDVHDYISEIIDNEVIGTDAVVNILMVDITIESGRNTWLRPFAVIADSEGDSMDAYTYSGTFAVKGDKTWGRATVSSDGMTATWAPDAA